MMTVKGLSKKQLIMLIEGKIDDDKICVTEGDMCWMFDTYADNYNVDSLYGELHYTLKKENSYWDGLRPFMPREGDKMKGIKLGKLI